MNTYEKYIWIWLKRKEAFKKQLLENKKDYTERDFEIKFHSTCAEINLLYMIISGHSSVVNPFNEKKEKKDFDAWNIEFENKSKLVY